MSTEKDFGNKYGDTCSQDQIQYPMKSYPPDTVIINQPYAEMSGRYDINAVLPIGHPDGYQSLNYLRMVDQLIVHQKVELLEVLCGCETRNKYKIKNSMGQEVYKATEDSDCIDRFCCGPLRPFDMKIVDNDNIEVMHFNRPLNCTGCFCPCCLQRLEVYASPNNLVGIVTEEWSFLRPNISVRTPDEKILFRISGPLCQISCCKDVVYPIYDEESGASIGKITKQWSGLLKELATDADNFAITFPIELEVNKKAALMGALFLIDFMYFEKTDKPRILDCL